mmetsp:Transcript_43751/g.86801  ORF Transcript_43751/g.86801 Transcript_43751/m.86801 type:complete len:423 (+) Transcript_43751:45-1313(+)|eukprot:CAMPEP_0172814274 /NCGR_PEP_ID=MMETSP1075-20121228/11147_1 /TAXON_ID=2916 /ORGANISM="Ceratium fusus, Strain PA161109" /LENGTH=422 /DNA_ID=CAMNT_0013654063 /DNA_START=44 /DNA_END=1312 /DNA_ORIENTATION=+
MAWSGRGGKGGGKGWSSNIPGMPRSTIDNLPQAGMAIFRETPDEAVDFCEKLKTALQPYPPGHVVFQNIDVATVEWTTLSFSVLLDVLQEKSVSTTRLKAYKCGLQDDCMEQIAQWLDTLPADRLPSEIHLSHNQITEDGFSTLFNSILAKRAELTTEMPPIWFRVESCKIDMSSDGPILGPLVKRGLIQFVNKLHERTPGPAALAMPLYIDPARVDSSSKPSVVGPPAVLAGKGAATTSAQQNRANVWDNKSWNASNNNQWNSRSGGTWTSGNSNGKNTNKGNNWWESSDAGRGESTNTGSSWPQQSWQQSDARGGFSGSSPNGQTGGCVRWQGFKTQMQEQAVEEGAQEAAEETAPAPVTIRGSAALGRDRSRTPGPKGATAPPEPPLPFGWEKHWSEEFKIPYFWNRETGESMWETPKE